MRLPDCTNIRKQAQELRALQCNGLSHADALRDVAAHEESIPATASTPTQQAGKKLASKRVRTANDSSCAATEPVPGSKDTFFVFCLVCFSPPDAHFFCARYFQPLALQQGQAEQDMFAKGKGRLDTLKVGGLLQGPSIPLKPGQVRETFPVPSPRTIPFVSSSPCSSQHSCRFVSTSQLKG